MEREETNFEPEVVNGIPQPHSKPVDFLTLIGQPAGILTSKVYIFTLLAVVYPHYMSEFEAWWDEGDAQNFVGYPFDTELEVEDTEHPGEQVYEYLLSSFGSYIFTSGF